MSVEIIEEKIQTGEIAVSAGNFNPARRALLYGCINFVRGLLTFAVTLLLTPFLVRHLGTAEFGAWSLLGLFVSYVALIDLGISGAAAKFTGELSPGEDVERTSQILVSSVMLLGVLAGGSILLSFFLRQYLWNGLAVFGLLGEKARTFLGGAVAIYSSGLIANGSMYFLLGLHRLDVANYVSGAVLLVQAIGTVVVLKAGIGLSGLIALTAGTSAMAAIVCFVCLEKVAPGLTLHWRYLNFNKAKQLLNFGIYLQAYALVSVYFFYVGKAVAGLSLTLAAVASYEVALKLPILFRLGSLTIVGPMMPAVSHLSANGLEPKIRTLLGQTLRYCLFLATPLFVCLAVFAEPVIHLWVGSEFADAILPLRLLSIGLGLSVIPDVIWYFLVGLGKHRHAAIISVIQVTLGTFLCYLLAVKEGLVGVALGVLITSFLAVLAYLALLVAQKILVITDLPIMLGSKVLIIAGAAYGTAFLLGQRFHWTLAHTAVAIFLASVTYLLAVMKLGMLEQHEKTILRKLLPSGLQFLF